LPKTSKIKGGYTDYEDNGLKIFRRGFAEGQRWNRILAAETRLVRAGAQGLSGGNRYTACE